MGAQGEHKIDLGLVHYPVLTLGPGRRLGIWLQGCSLRCPGCLAPHTWEAEEGDRLTVANLMEEQVLPHLEEAGGVTISGGEPFDQPEALEGLVGGLRSAGCADVMLYSGYRREELTGRALDVLPMIDVLVEGRFVAGRESTSHWRGSENQEMVIMTGDETLRDRYERYRDTAVEQRELQVIGKGGKVFVLGIPWQKDAERIRHAAR